MDERREFLEDYIKKLIQKGLTIVSIVDMVVAMDNLSHKEPYFLDESVFGPLASSPVKAATKMVLEISEGNEEDEEYRLYRMFFDEHFKGAKKDIISKKLLKFDGSQWQCVTAHLDAIKSYAKAKGLKPTQVPIHIDRYIMNRKCELLIKVPKWDGVDRVAQLASFVKIKNQKFEVFEAALKEWGANIFRRLYHDIYQNRCIILKGGQGIGKDHLLKSLLKGFGPYYSKFSTNRNENEAWAQVSSKLVLHIEEFDQTGQLSVAFLKDLITRDWVTYRAPYAVEALTRKCVGSFISTVNIDAVLRDETGNRRFAVFEIESIDWKYPKDWSEQILAQFNELYKSGYWASDETWAAVTSGNTNYEQVNMVPELLHSWDMRTSRISQDKKVLLLRYGDIDGVVKELAHQAGWRSKAILGMLKSNNRSRHTENGTMYWSEFTRQAVNDVSKERNYQFSDQQKDE